MAEWWWPSFPEEQWIQVLMFSRSMTWGRNWTSLWTCICSTWNAYRSMSRSTTQRRGPRPQQKGKRKRTTGILIWKPSSATTQRQVPQTHPTASTRCPSTESAPMGIFHGTPWTWPKGDLVQQRLSPPFPPREIHMQRGPQFCPSWLFWTHVWATTHRQNRKAPIRTASHPARDAASLGTVTRLCPSCPSTTRSWSGLQVASASPRTEMIICLAPVGDRAGWERRGTWLRGRRTQTQTPSRLVVPCLCHPLGMAFRILYGPLPTSPLRRGHWMTPGTVDRLCTAHLLSRLALTIV